MSGAIIKDREACPSRAVDFPPSNLQVWNVVADQEGERKNRLSALAGNKAYVRQAQLFFVWLADIPRVSRIALHHLESLLLGTIYAALAAQMPW